MADASDALQTQGIFIADATAAATTFLSEISTHKTWLGVEINNIFLAKTPTDSTTLNTFAYTNWFLPNGFWVLLETAASPVDTFYSNFPPKYFFSSTTDLPETSLLFFAFAKIDDTAAT